MYGLIGIIIFSIALIFLVLLGVFIFNKMLENNHGQEKEKSIKEAFQENKEDKRC
jgi:hypothetical protein